MLRRRAGLWLRLLFWLQLRLRLRLRLFGLFLLALLLLSFLLFGFLLLLHLGRRNELDADCLLLRRLGQFERQVEQEQQGDDEMQGNRRRRAPSYPFPPFFRKKPHRQ